MNPAFEKVARGLAGALMLAAAGAVFAASPLLGTWEPQPATPQGLTLTVEECCDGGLRLVYKVKAAEAPAMTIESKLDGADAPVLVGGQPSGQTMAIKLVGALRFESVIKANGQTIGNTTGTLSEDGKTLTVENDVRVTPNGKSAGKITETWVRK
jgi:hypothetical protein